MTTSELDLYERLHLRANKYADRTIAIYKSAILEFLAFVGNSDITHKALIAFRDHVTALPLSIATKNLKIVAVRSFLGFHNRRREEDPLEFRDTLQTFHDRTHKNDHFVMVDGAVIESFLSVLEKADYRAFVAATIMTTSGLRLSEVLSLTKGEFATSFFLVGKGSRQRRVLASQATVDLVRDFEERVATDKLFPMSARQLQRIFHNFSAGKITPHTLRHFYATNLAENGMDIRVIQELLGHASIVTTQRYAHVSDEFLKSEYDKVHKPL